MMIRSVADGDRDAIFALGVAEEAAWFGRAEISAEEIGEWIEEEGGVASGVVAVDGAGNVRGFAAPGRHQAVFLADPTRTSLVTDELLPWLRERCDVVRLMTFAGDVARVAAFERHGRPVGWIAGRVLASGRGYLDMLAVAMSERHRGLGRALLLHAFADLQLAGGRELTLGAQAENAAALGVYRSVGMEVEREWRIYATASNEP